MMTVAADLTNDFRMKGEVVTKDTGNPSYSTKSAYASFENEDDYIASLESESSIDIEEITFDGMDKYSPNVTTTYSFTKDLDVAGDYIYINPFMYAFHSKDTFQSLKREYPIDFPYAYNITYLFTLNIPEGYAIDQLPENKTFKFEVMGSTVRCIFGVTGNTLQMVFNYGQNSMFCEAVHYEDVKTYWQYLAQMYDAVVVLKKL